MIKPYIILAALKVGPRILCSRLTWMRKYAKHPESAPIEVRYKRVRHLIIKIINALKIDVKANNLDCLNNHEGTFLGISNHRHAFDPLFYIYLSEKPVSFIAKKEAFDMPFVKQIMKSIDAFSIDREDLMHQLALFKAVAERLKKNDLSYFVFAEGTRQKNFEVVQTLPYKDGALKPAYWAEKDVIFVATHGTELVTKSKPQGFKKRNATFEFQCLAFNEIKNKNTTEVMPVIEKITNNTLVKIAKENNARNLK